MSSQAKYLISILWMSTKQTSARKLQEKKEQDAKVENENRVIEKVVENAQMEMPEPMVDTQAREMVEDYARRLQSQGLTINAVHEVYRHDTGEADGADASGGNEENQDQTGS